jgi:hypothetical protein
VLSGLKANHGCHTALAAKATLRLIVRNQFDMFCLNIWKNYVGDCMSVKVK